VDRRPGPIAQVLSLHTTSVSFSLLVRPRELFLVFHVSVGMSEGARNEQTSHVFNKSEINQSTLFDKPMFFPYITLGLVDWYQKPPIVLGLWKDGVRQDGPFAWSEFIGAV
jgi:hypothetical protein